MPMVIDRITYTPQFQVDPGPGDIAPVLVLANSLGTTTALWTRTLQAWTRRFRVLRFDYPGHGGAVDAPIDSIGQIASSLLHALDRDGIDDFHFGGISMGGAVGLAIAGQAGTRLRSLVIANSATRFGTEAFWRARMGLVEHSGTSAVAEATVARWLREETARRDAALHECLLRMFASTTAAGYRSCASAVMSFDGTPLLGAVTAPALVISGTQDEATPPELGRELHRGLAGSHHVEIDSAHLANVDAPDALCRTVAAFHDSLLPPPRA